MQQRATAAQIDLFSERKIIPVPRLSVEWQPFWPQFFDNVQDLFRKPPPLLSSSRPGEYWPDVFVSRPVPWKDIARSVFFHAAFVFFFFMTGRYWLFPAPVTIRA